MNFDDILDSFLELHPKIKHFLCSDIGIKLQNLDAKLTDYVVNRSIVDGVPCLGVHDSFIVSECYASWITSMMNEAIEQNNIISIPNIC